MAIPFPFPSKNCMVPFTKCTSIINIGVGARGARGAGAPIIIWWPDKVITRLSGYRLSLNSITF